MTLNFLPMRPEQRRRLKAGWLLAACLSAVYFSLQPLNRAREIANQRSTGLGAVAGGSISELIVSKITQRNSLAREQDTYFQRGAEEPVSASLMGFSAPSFDERQLVRSSSLNLVVKDPVDASEQIRRLAEQAGGYLTSSRLTDYGTPNGSISIRVPVSQFEEVRKQIRQLGLRVDSDTLEAQDVTKNYVDREARMRSLAAQEQQYLQILKKAVTVKDTLEVSDKLGAIRSQIEQQKAEFDALSKQVETVAIEVYLQSDADAQVLGIRWRPLYRLKLATRDGLDGLSVYIASMTAFAFLLPTILLWLMTFVAGASIAWRLLRWLARVFFHYPKTEKAVS